MQLVGATSGFIRKPYVLNSLLLGSISAVLSMAMLYGVGVALGNYFPTFIALISIETTLMVFGLMLLMSLVVPGISTAIAIRKYLKLRTNELYF
jgi:cell division transport system permease protein